MRLTRLIEAYLEGSLGDKERKEFMTRLNDDTELKDLLKMHAEVNESIRDEELHALRKRLSEIGNAYLEPSGNISEDKGSKDRNVWKENIRVSVYFRAVSALLLLIAAGFILKTLFFRELPAEVIYDKFYLPYEVDIVMRSADTDDDALKGAIISYQNEDYNDAYEAFAVLPEEVADTSLVSFYRGLTCLGLDRYDEAIIFLSHIPEEWPNPHVVHRDWYLALAYLKTGEVDKAIEILNDIKSSNGYYADKASKILSRIRT